MKLAYTLIGSLMVTTLGLLWSHAGLVRSNAALGSRNSAQAAFLRQQVDAVQKEVTDLAGERTRLARIAGELRSALRDVERLSSDEALRVEREATAGAEDAGEVRDRPSPMEIPHLSKEDMTELVIRRDAIDPRPSDQILISGTIDDILADPSWNRDGRELTTAERAELRRLVLDYQYFQRHAMTERHDKFMSPEKERLEAAGAFVEYDAARELPPVPRPDGRPVISMASGTGPDSTVLRLYYFYREDYPELYYWKVVEGQRSLERYVQIHELINP